MTGCLATLGDPVFVRCLCKVGLPRLFKMLANFGVGFITTLWWMRAKAAGALQVSNTPGCRHRCHGPISR